MGWRKPFEWSVLILGTYADEIYTSKQSNEHIITTLIVGEDALIKDYLPAFLLYLRLEVDEEVDVILCLAEVGAIFCWVTQIIGYFFVHISLRTLICLVSIILDLELLGRRSQREEGQNVMGYMVLRGSDRAQDRVDDEK